MKKRRLKVVSQHYHSLFQENSNDIDQLYPPEFEKMMEMIEKMKNNKSPGEDGIPAELLKKGSKSLLKEFYNIILSIWVKEEMQSNGRRESYALFIRRETQVCYQGITLFQCAYKVLSNILYWKLMPYAEIEIGDYQAGFRHRRSLIVNQILSLRTIF